MENFHIITAKYLPYTNTKPARIRIRSDRFKETVIVSYHEYETAVEWLKEKGFNIVGTGSTNKEIIIVTNTFKPLKSYA